MPDDEGPAVIVGLRVSDIGPEPYVPSVERPCITCGEQTYISIGTATMLLIAGTDVMCMTCFNAETANEPEVEVNLLSDALAKVSEHTGRPFTLEDAQRLIAKHYPGQHIRVRVNGDTDPDKGVNK